MFFLAKQVRLVEGSDQRFDQYDLLKGIYIVFVILSHSFTNFISEASRLPGHSKVLTALRLIVFAVFHGTNAMLMIVCGLQFRKKSMRTIVQSQVKHLWKPFLYTVLATFIAVVITTWVTGGNILAETARKVLPLALGNVDNTPYFGIPMVDGCGPMWFIIVFVVSGIMLNAVLQIKDVSLQWITVILLYFTGKITGIWTNIPEYLPFGIYRGMKYTLYMYIGYQIKKTAFFDKRFPVWLLIFAAFFAVHFVLLEQNNDVSCLVIAFGSMVVASRLDGIKLRLFKGLRRLGRMIMPFCCIHTVFYKTFTWEFMQHYFANNSALCAMVLLVIYTVTGIGGCMLLDNIKRRRIMKRHPKAIGGN